MTNCLQKASNYVLYIESFSSMWSNMFSVCTENQYHDVAPVYLLLLQYRCASAQLLISSLDAGDTSQLSLDAAAMTQHSYD